MRIYKAAEAICDIAVGIQKVRRRVSRASRGQPIPILHLIETGGPGGAERMLLDLVRHLGPEYQSIIGLLKSGWLQAQVLSSGIPHAMVNGDGLGDLGVIARILQVVRGRDIQLMHTHEFYMSMIGASVSCLSGIPLVVTLHGKNYYPDKRRRCVIYRLVAARAAAMVAVSQDLRHFFCRVTGVNTKSVQVIHNGVDTELTSDKKRNTELLKAAGIPANASVIGTVGNLYPVKGHIHLIRALPSILRHRPETYAVILGRGEMEEALGAEARSLGIQNRVHLLGYREDAHQWLSVMDVFALPSLSEGLPLSLLEAMAVGIPTVVTRVGGMPEVVRDGQTGFIVPPAEPDALASKILFLLKNPDIASKVGAAGRHHIRERFSLGRMVEEYRGLYHEALASTTPGKIQRVDSLES